MGLAQDSHMWPPDEIHADCARKLAVNVSNGVLLGIDDAVFEGDLLLQTSQFGLQRLDECGVLFVLLCLATIRYALLSVPLSVLACRTL